MGKTMTPIKHNEWDESEQDDMPHIKQLDDDNRGICYYCD